MAEGLQRTPSPIFSCRNVWCYFICTLFNSTELHSTKKPAYSQINNEPNTPTILVATWQCLPFYIMYIKYLDNNQKHFLSNPGRESEAERTLAFLGPPSEAMVKIGTTLTIYFLIRHFSGTSSTAAVCPWTNKTAQSHRTIQTEKEDWSGWGGIHSMQLPARTTYLCSTISSLLYTEPNEPGVSHLHQNVVDTVDMDAADASPFHVLHDTMGAQSSVQAAVAIFKKGVGRKNTSVGQTNQSVSIPPFLGFVRPKKGRLHATVYTFIPFSIQIIDRSAEPLQTLIWFATNGS